MKTCDKHWAMMRKAVEDRGMWHLVAPSGEEALRRAQEELAGRKEISDYDPLMSINWMVTNKALKLGGLYLMTTKEDGSGYCPVCEVMEHLTKMPDGDGRMWTPEELEKEWIDGPADAALNYCREHGLMPKIQ